MTDQDQELEQQAQRAGARLRDSEHDVPPEVAQRLAQMRRQAVAAADGASSSAWDLWPRFVGVGAVLSAALLVAVLVRTPTDVLPRLDEAELAAAQEAELLEELEFVAWMVAMEEADELPNSG